jgi:hypothetical protein
MKSKDEFFIAIQTRFQSKHRGHHTSSLFDYWNEKIFYDTLIMI